MIVAHNVGKRDKLRLVLEPQSDDERRFVEMFAEALENGGSARVRLKDGRSLTIDFDDGSSLEVIRE